MSDGYGDSGGSRNGNSYGGRGGSRNGNSYGNGRGNGNSYGNGVDRICHFFSKDGTCRNGTNCKFSHHQPSSTTDLNQNNNRSSQNPIVKHYTSTNNAVSATQNNNFTDDKIVSEISFFPEEHRVNSNNKYPTSEIFSMSSSVKSSMKSSVKAEETLLLEDWVIAIRMTWGIPTGYPSINIDNKEYIEDISLGLGFQQDSSRSCIQNVHLINTMLSNSNGIKPKIHAIHTMTSKDCPCTVIDVLSWVYSNWSITKENNYDIKDTSEIGWAAHNVDTIFAFIKQLE